MLGLSLRMKKKLEYPPWGIHTMTGLKDRQLFEKLILDSHLYDKNFQFSLDRYIFMNM